LHNILVLFFLVTSELDIFHPIKSTHHFSSTPTLQTLSSAMSTHLHSTLTTYEQFDSFGKKIIHDLQDIIDNLLNEGK
jgi:hypothetical protein